MINSIKRFAERMKLVTALAALFLSGALIAIGSSVAYYDRVISSIHGSYGGRIAGLNRDVRMAQRETKEEREVTRQQLNNLMAAQERIIEMLENASKTAEQAAATAKGAAINAAQSAIRVREIKE